VGMDRGRAADRFAALAPLSDRGMDGLVRGAVRWPPELSVAGYTQGFQYRKPPASWFSRSSASYADGEGVGVAYLETSRWSSRRVVASSASSIRSHRVPPP
jgi:hypothetical protein